MNLPLVSVAIPAYRHAHFIEATLAAVCAQTYPELELVVIDDGSPDDTYQVAERYLQTHQSRFRRVLLQRNSNQGVSANSNACIQACQGEWVHLLGSDDLIYPDKIARIQQAATDWADHDLALIHTDCDFVDQHGQPIARNRLRPRPQAGPQADAYRWIFTGEHSIYNPSIALHRAKFLAAGGFDPNLALEDIDCWLRLSASHGIARVPEVLASYRKHPGNSLLQRVRMLGAQFITYAKFLESHPGLIPDKLVRQQFRKNVWRFWRRIRKHAPNALPRVLRAYGLSFLATPTPNDYRRLGEILNQMDQASQLKR